MARKRRRKGSQSQRDKGDERPAREPDGPFAALKELRDKLREPPDEKPVEEPPPPAGLDEPKVDDEELFSRAMAGVEPMLRRKRLADRPPGGTEPQLPPDEERRAMEELDLLVRGEIRFRVADTAEVIEGEVIDLDPRVVKRLRRGAYSVQANLDLHGMDLVRAKEATRAFILASLRAGHRCVRVVHGKGMHSKSVGPVIKEHIKQWLTRGSVGRCVLAFTSAPRSDGGTGAIYVLLRRSPASGDKKKPFVTRE